MLMLSGSPKKLCNGVTRRELLQIGGISGLGLSSLQAATPTQSAPKAKACIFVFLFGSPPQHETFDPKPQAPREIQGEMSAISTCVPGLQLGEGLPLTATIADRLTIVRSMTHDYPIHCCAYVMTGMPTYSIPLETAPRDPQHWPFIGSVVDYLDSQQRSQPASMPANVGLPWRFCSRGTSSNQAGPYGAFCQLPADLSPARFDARRHLLSRFDAARSSLDTAAETLRWSAQQQRAFSLVGSHSIRQALDVHRESHTTRSRYGLNLFGQSCLAARRLVEAGARFVSVFWDPFGPHGASVWDTHSNHFPRLRNYLLPVFDQTWSALISDLHDRGLLDETLVLCTSEHGRTPQIDSGPRGGARHHWSRVYSSVFAGGGMAQGKVVGSSDAIGGDVADTPISPKDMQATAYHLLGFPEDATIPDPQGRPLRIAGSGQVRPELLQ